MTKIKPNHIQWPPANMDTITTENSAVPVRNLRYLNMALLPPKAQEKA
jgi:hypothetical protein